MAPSTLPTRAAIVLKAGHGHDVDGWRGARAIAARRFAFLGRKVSASASPVPFLPQTPPTQNDVTRFGPIVPWDLVDRTNFAQPRGAIWSQWDLPPWGRTSRPTDDPGPAP